MGTILDHMTFSFLQICQPDNFINILHIFALLIFFQQHSTTWKTQQFVWNIWMTFATTTKLARYFILKIIHLTYGNTKNQMKIHGKSFRIIWMMKSKKHFVIQCNLDMSKLLYSFLHHIKTKRKYFQPSDILVNTVCRM